MYRLVESGCAEAAQILGWDTEHLYRAATDRVSTAEHWADSFTSVHRGTLSPGGTVREASNRLPQLRTRMAASAGSQAIRNTVIDAHRSPTKSKV
jgi:hypothetical protein